MRDVMLLRLDAPLMSFGAPSIDAFGLTARHPSRSMLTGLLGNALGWDHGDWERLDGLQRRLRWAARLDREGGALREYQTVDLGQPHLSTEGKSAVSWTTRGAIDQRGGGPDARLGTHQRWRDHWADSVCTVAIGLDGDGSPTLEELARALRHPARPLFLGRKHCLPAAPLVQYLTRAASLADALSEAPVDWQRISVGERVASLRPTHLRAWWPADEESAAIDGPVELLSVTEERDWRNQIHGGERRIHHGMLRLREGSDVH